MRWALQAAEKFNSVRFCNKGTALAGPQKQQNKGWALQAAEKLATEGGGGFIPRIKPIKSTSALAAEGMFSGALPQTKPFSAACLAPAEIALVICNSAKVILQVAQLSPFSRLADYFSHPTNLNSGLESGPSSTGRGKDPLPPPNPPGVSWRAGVWVQQLRKNPDSARKIRK